MNPNNTYIAFLLSHPDFQQKNIELCIKLLLDNGYSLDLIFEKINIRLKKLITTTNHNKTIANYNTIPTSQTKNIKNIL